MTSLEGNEDDNLETLLAKATNPLHREPDPDAVKEFCALIVREHDGPQTALRLLAHKIQSPIEKESLMALTVLEETVRQCGIKYRSEIGKFRFLNEMIKVVSPKYLGNRASTKVKQKIVELMYIWSLEIRNETKIAEAYQMLKRQGVVIEDPVYLLDNYEPLPVPPPRHGDDPIFGDEEKSQQLQKLLRSRNADDLLAANRLIKNMVREADKKMEIKAKRSSELETVHNNVSVLEDMLSHYRPGESSDEEKDLMKELYESCEQWRPKLFRLAGELEEKDEGLGDILKANDDLTAVINNYKKIMKLSSENGTVSAKEASLLDLASPIRESQSVSSSSNQSILDDQLLALGIGDIPKDSTSPLVKETNRTASQTGTNSTLADLDQIFSSSLQTNPLTTNSSLPQTLAAPFVINSSNAFLGGDSCNVPSLTPVSSSTSIKSTPPAALGTSNNTSKGLEFCDLEQSLKESLPSSSVAFDFKSTPQKIPLSQLMQQKNQQKTESLLSTSTASAQDDVPCLMSTSPQSGKTSPACSPAHSVLSLQDVFVPLETIQPGSVSPLNLHEKNGLNVVIHFGKDSPRPDITVMVVSTMSKNSSPVKNVSFQAAVPKSMKVKLQPPSATDLPAHNPILPPAAITQVMLLTNPQKENVRFKYKVNYTIDGHNHTDVGEVDSLLAPR